MAELVLTLPFPPSVNRLWRRAKNKRMCRSPEYKSWLREAGLWWMSQRPMSKVKSISGGYAISLRLYPPSMRRNRDADNYIKAVNDLLQSLGVVENDHLQRRIEIEWGDGDIFGPRVEVTLRSMPLAG